MATEEEYRHLLNRISFGIAPQDLSRVKSMGIQTLLNQQLSPQNTTESKKLIEKLKPLKTLEMTPLQLFNHYGGRSKQKKPKQEVIQESLEAYLLRSIYSNRQLEAVMIDFWLNHFSVYLHKGLTGIWIGAYTQQAIAPHALGKFRTLLGATAKHPAMLYYLDNYFNTSPQSSKARGRFKGLNENYARELMELHTLGVNGGYTQEDVINLARILTGWGLIRLRESANNESSGFYFDPMRHDWGSKTLLGVTFSGEGEAEVEKALDLLADHPQTAQHLSYKLVQYFVTDNPPEALVSDLAKTFLTSQGDIPTVLNQLFTHPLFWDKKYYDNKFKTPYQYIISLYRLHNHTDINPQKPMVDIGQLGMLPYHCPSPQGYSYTQDIWLNPDAVLKRLNIAMKIGRDSHLNPEEILNILGNTFSENTLKVVANNSPDLSISLLLGSPEMMYR